jgi:hypothetical protein
MDLLCSVIKLPFSSDWQMIEGKNSYCFCPCSGRGNQPEHRMTIEEGAPYFYAVLTKDDDTIDFPTGTVLTIQDPDGTKYDRDLQTANQLVIMSGSSVRCLIIKDPKPGIWTMTLTAPETVGYQCECSTVPTANVYDTIENALKNSLQKRDLGIGSVSVLGWGGFADISIILSPLELGVAAVILFIAYGLYTGKDGNSQKPTLPNGERGKLAKALHTQTQKIYQNKGKTYTRQYIKQVQNTGRKKEKGIQEYVYAVVHDGGENFLMATKNAIAYFYHPDTVRRNGIPITHGPAAPAFPGGGLDQGIPPWVGALKEFHEETYEYIDEGFNLSPTLYEGQEGSAIKYYGVYFEVTNSVLGRLRATIEGNLLEATHAAGHLEK